MKEVKYNKCPTCDNIKEVECDYCWDCAECFGG